MMMMKLASLMAVLPSVAAVDPTAHWVYASEPGAASDAKAQRGAFFSGFGAALDTPNRVTYIEETIRALEAGELTLSSRSLEQERSGKALDKRVKSLTSLLVASTLLNVALGAAVGPWRKAAFWGAAFFGLKGQPALLK